MPTLQESVPPERPHRFLVAWAVTLAGAMLATMPLWTPLRDTPRIVPWSGLSLIPPGIDFGLIVVLALGVVRVAFSGRAWRRSLVMAVAALAGLMALDQLRWQPWAYHALIAAIVLTDHDTRRALGRLRWITVAVYAYSALAKLDAEFARTLGSQMVEVLGKPFGIEAASLEEGTRHALALSLPQGELAVAGLLAVAIYKQQLGRWGALTAVAMHLMTIGVLGPWALGHSLGVLVWNVGFAWQTVVLFGFPQRVPTAPPVSGRAFFAEAAAALAVATPFFTVVGWWDQWPGWALYAPGGERAEIYVRSDAVMRLPESLRDDYLESDEDGWRRVRLDAWLLDDTLAPIYPQNRAVAAFAVGLAERYRVGDQLRVVEESGANRWTAKRTVRELEGVEAFRRASRLGPVAPSVVWTR